MNPLQITLPRLQLLRRHPLETKTIVTLTLLVKIETDTLVILCQEFAVVNM